MTRSVWVTVPVVGFHAWPDAPPFRSYLAHQHRHVFNVRAEVEIEADRGIEYHDLKDVVVAFIAVTYAQAVHTSDARSFGSRSCEQIAYEVAMHLRTLYGRAVKVSVDEDGENGSTVGIVA